ncbi:MAG: hypothetical protein FJ398_02075 [Verrucomicrobia bacterium]|nr:hypothetical protein [Verrucomicrobiota bacterium]
MLIEATATDRDGSVSQVEFFEGSRLLGRVDTAPYRWTWTNAPAGNYRLYARATDNLGGVTTSLPLNVAIRPRGPEGRTEFRSEAGFELSLSVSADGIYRIETSTDLANWTSLGTNRQLILWCLFVCFVGSNRRFQVQLLVPEGFHRVHAGRTEGRV